MSERHARPPAFAWRRIKSSPASAAMPASPRGKKMTMAASMAPQHEAPILRDRLQLVLQQREREGADDGAEEAGEAAEHGHEHEMARVRPMHELRVGEADAKAQNGAADGAVDGGDDEGRAAGAGARARPDIRPSVRLSRSDRRCKPNGECTMRHMSESRRAPSAPGSSSRRARPEARSCCRRRTPARGCACAEPACRCRRRSEW